MKSSEKGRRWLLAGLVAGGVFLVLELAEPFIALPLREISSAVAHFLLGAGGLAVTRNGTILSTPRMTFDVVPACSGSTTLQALLFVAITWCGVQPGLTPVRRAAAVALALPLAILANALRVSVLVVAGHAIGGEPGGAFHVAVGLVAFALAMLGCFAIAGRLARSSVRQAAGNAWISVALLLLLGFLGAPFIMWCLDAWGRSPLDRFSYVFVAIAAVAAGWIWRCAPSDASWERAGTVGFGLSLAALLLATLIDVNILKGISLMGALLSLGLSIKGIRFARSAALLALVAYLGFPTTSYQLGLVSLGVGMTLKASLMIKAALAAGLLAALRIPYFRLTPAPPAPRAPRLLPVQAVLTALLAAFQTYYYGISWEGFDETRLEMSYLQGEWVGRDREIPSSEEEHFGRGRVWARRYTLAGDVVDVLVSSTGGDRHRAHPPAYCLTGDGWEPIRTGVEARSLGNGRTVPMTLMRLRKGVAETTLCFWFTDGSEVHATFADMLLRDTLRRLAGRRTDWFIFRVISGSGDGALENFLASFQAVLAPPDRRGGDEPMSGLRHQDFP
ncbi:MAG: exosortase/archaeosortase family protein [Planctomycetes bacterium]|nr:exosortase/archaeosortase family protein [Planctomycetota bacterium]